MKQVYLLNVKNIYFFKNTYKIFFIFLILSVITTPGFSQIVNWGSALQLNGDDSNYIEIPDFGTEVLGNNSSNTSFTIETWFKDNGSAFNTIFSKHSNVTFREGFTLERNGSTGSVIAVYANSSNAWTSVGGTKVVNDGAWHHLAMVYERIDGTTGRLRLYIDGELQGTSADFTPQHARSDINLWMLNSQHYSPATGNSQTNGILDEFRIWNRVRTQEEMLTNLYRELAGTEPNLYAYYKMSDGSGTTLTDDSSTSFDGTLVGTISWVSSGIPQPFAGGDGTSGNPFQITQWSHLYNMRNFLSSSFLLNNSINNSTAGYNAYASSTAFGGSGWLPIGNGVSRFTGVLNGGGNVIQGLFINRPTELFLGLFGYIQGASLQDLGLLDVNLTAKNQIGALAGVMLSSGSITRCYSTGAIIAETDAAGLIAQLDGSVSTITVSECFSTADVTASLAVGSGLLGWAQNVAVSNSYALGDVTVTNSLGGGLVARSTGSTITNSYAAGSVSAASSAGGLIGFTDASPSSTITNSYWDTEMSGLGTSAGGVGRNTSQMKSQGTFSGWNFTAGTGIWQIREASGGFISYPYLQGITYDAPLATPAANPIPGLTPVLNLSSSVPAANATGIAAGDDIVLTFDSPPSLATLTASNAVVRGQQSGTIAGTWTVSGNDATFNPTSDLTAGEVIHVELGTGVGGTNGGFLLSPENFSFTVASASPLSGATWRPILAAEANAWQSVTYGNDRFVAVSTTGTNRIMYSADGISWTAVTAPEANFWRSVSYGNGRFVAVSFNGTNRVMYSDDGVSWTAVSAAASEEWISVTYGNGRFVAVSRSNFSNQVMYSDDGVIWTAASATEANFWRSVSYGNGRFVAVSNSGTNRVMYSVDGVSWTAASATEANQWGSVTYGNGRFVAVAIDGTNRVMYSNDGISWTAASAAEANQWNSVTYGNGRFVATAESGTNRVMYSNDGISWTPAPATEANLWQSVTYGNGRFVAVAPNGTNRVMVTSPPFALSSSVPTPNGTGIAAGDDIVLTFDSPPSLATLTASNAVVRGQQSGTIAGSWSVSGNNATFNPASDLTAGEVIHVELGTGVGGTNGGFLFSPENFSFTVASAPPLLGDAWIAAPAAEANQWLSVTYGNGLFVAVAQTGTNRIMYSNDGITWTAAAAPEANSWISVTYGNGRFVAVSTDGTNRVMYSDDGISWTAASAALANPWWSVTYGSGRFVAVSVDARGTSRVMYSADGISWTAASAAEANQWRSVTYGNGRFVAVARDGTNRVMYSDGGISWTAASAAEAHAWLSVTYGNGRFVAVAEATNRVMYSADGISWTAVTAPEANSWRSVSYGNGRFVAVSDTGTNRVMYSNDGASWTAAPAAEANSWFGVTYGNGRFVAVGASGTNRVMVSLSAFVWTGTTDSDTGDGSNWGGGAAPPAGSDISIPTGLGNYPVFSADYQAGDLEIQSGATFTMAPGFVLTFAAGKGATGDGKIILQSDATGDASIGDLTGAGAITVDVEQERFVAGNNRAFRFFSHPFTTAMPLSVLAGRIDITGNGGATNGFTTTETNNPSAFRFDPTVADDGSPEDAGWVPFTNTSQTIAPVEGIRVLVRGSKGQAGSLLDGAYTPDAVTMSWEGTINAGNVVKNLASATIGGAISDWNLVGNPYPSAINMRNITNAGASNFITVWNPRAGDAGGDLIPGAGRGGAYLTRLLTDGGFDPIVLPSGSAFFIQADPLDSGTPGALTFTENMKIDGATPLSVLRVEEVSSRFGANSLQLTLSKGDQLYDQVVVYLQDATEASYDKQTDGIKLANPVVNFFTVSEDNFALSNDTRAYDETEGLNRIPVHILSPATNFTLRIPDLDLSEGRTMQLYDRYTEEYITLERGGEYDFEITEDANSRGHRFDLIMGGQVVTSLQNLQNELQVFLMPNPAEDQVAITFRRRDELQPTEIRIVDMQGQTIEQATIKPEEDSRLDYPVSRLRKGMYLIEVRQGAVRQVKKLVVR